MVPPLPGAPRTHSTWRNNESCNVLKGVMRTSIRSRTKSCRACQINKKQKLKYGHLSLKTVITVSWRALCVDLIGRYTLTGKDGTVIDFMALTMIDPTTSWCKIVELPLIRWLKTITIDGKESSIVEEIFDKTSNPQTNAILECLHQVLAQMLRTAELDMAKTVTPMTLMSFLSMRHEPFALPITQSLKPLQERQYLDTTCSLSFRS